MAYKLLLAAILFTLAGCVEEPIEGEVGENSVVVHNLDLDDDALVPLVCVHPTHGSSPFEGTMRCSTFAVQEEVDEDGKTWVLIDTTNCNLPVLGSGWDCEALMRQVDPEE